MLIFALALIASLQASAGQGSAAGASSASRSRPVCAAVQRAGTYHLASGTWLSGATGSGVGPSVIYNSSCLSDPVYAWLVDPGQTVTDEGRIPSPSGPSDQDWNRPGCAASYVVNGFELGYCTNRTSVDVDLRFIENYALCTDPTGYPTLAAFHLPGMPGSSVQGSYACWVVTIDLSGLEFTIAADGNGEYSPSGTFGELSGAGDRFGWTIEFSGDSGDAGPIESGQSFPVGSACPPPATSLSFDGTIFDPIVDLSEPGIGMSTTDWFWYDEGAFQGCRSFSWGGFYLRLYSSTVCPPRPGTSFCYGDGSGTPCPCYPTTPGFREGCENSYSDGAAHFMAGILLAQGTASLGADTLQLYAAGMRPNTSALFFQGTQRVQGGAGSQFGDGLRCAGGTVRRLGIQMSRPSGTAVFPVAGGPSASLQGQVAQPGVRTYQVWFRVAVNFCNPSTFNLTNGWEVDWTL